MSFGREVTVSNDYETAFYAENFEGVVRITDELILTPRTTFPGTPEEGMICVKGTGVNRHIYCYMNSSWHQLD